MNPKEPWECFFDLAEKKLESSGNDHAMLPEELRIVMLIVSAQGIIDNGGYRYFFEQDWDGKPPYQVFVDAYAAIGHAAAARDLKRVVKSFSFPEPHLQLAAREQYIETHFDKDLYEVPAWGDALCGDESVWSKLDQFCQKHRAKFGL